MSMIKFIYNMNKAEIDYENIEKSLLNHINKILGNNYEEFLHEIEFTDEKLRIAEGQVNFGQYNQNLKRIIIRKDAFDNIIGTVIHEIFHVKFAINNFYFYNNLNEKGAFGYNFINEFITTISATEYLFKLDIDTYNQVFLTALNKYMELDKSSENKRLEIISEYEDIMISLDYNNEEIDKKLKRVYDELMEKATHFEYSAYNNVQRYANIFIVNKYYKLNYDLGKQDPVYYILENLKGCKITPEICNDIFNR